MLMRAERQKGSFPSPLRGHVEKPHSRAPERAGCPQNAAVVPGGERRGRGSSSMGSWVLTVPIPVFRGAGMRRWPRDGAVPVSRAAAGAARDGDPGDAPGNRFRRSLRGGQSTFPAGKKNTPGLSELLKANFARNDFKSRVFLDKPGGIPVTWRVPPVPEPCGSSGSRLGRG